MLATLLFSVALIGLTACTVFLLLIIVAALRRRRTAAPLPPHVDHYPPITLLKPLCGMEPRLEENLESFFRQDYPRFQLVFGARQKNDPALEVVQTLSRRHPHVPVEIVLSGEPDRPNAKVCSLEKMMGAARFDYLVISDSDVHVTPDYVRRVIEPLLDPRVGLVTCLYRGVPTGGLWSRLEALGMSVEMTSGVIVADMFEGMRFALGPTMALRRDVLDAIGGFSVLADYCADDYVIGEKVFESGRQVVLSPHVIEHVVLNRSFRDSVLHQVRWMKSTRFSRPKGHVGSGLTFAMPFGLLGGLTGLAVGQVGIGLALLAWAFLNRCLMAVIAGGCVVADARSVLHCWLYPMRDLMGFGFWVASFLGTTIVWRKERYQLQPGGRMVRVSPAESASGAVAVDRLA
ncbi:MAG: bacteriohopanetetrol glucosamine biosynthesis glycosyltransferase HpnI [Terriglobales bacterium]